MKRFCTSESSRLAFFPLSVAISKSGSLRLIPTTSEFWEMWKKKQQHQEVPKRAEYGTEVKRHGAITKSTVKSRVVDVMLEDSKALLKSKFLF